MFVVVFSSGVGITKNIRYVIFLCLCVRVRVYEYVLVCACDVNVCKKCASSVACVVCGACMYVQI